MQKLQRARPTPASIEATRKALMSKDNEWWEKTEGVQFLDDESREAYIMTVLERENKEMWANDIYCVHKEDHGEMVHLSIKRHDRAPCLDWRHKQEIKNQLVGPECEGLELYPAESRVVDTSNQFHLWCFKTMKLEIGFQMGFKTDEPMGLSKQRKLEDGN